MRGQTLDPILSFSMLSWSAVKLSRQIVLFVSFVVIDSVPQDSLAFHCGNYLIIPGPRCRRHCVNSYAGVHPLEIKASELGDAFYVSEVLSRAVVVTPIAFLNKILSQSRIETTPPRGVPASSSPALRIELEIVVNGRPRPVSGCFMIA